MSGKFVDVTICPAIALAELRNNFANPAPHPAAFQFAIVHEELICYFAIRLKRKMSVNAKERMLWSTMFLFWSVFKFITHSTRAAAFRSPTFPLSF
jgi:hypothetical protein